MSRTLRESLRLLALAALAALSMQLYFVIRVAMLTVVDPASTSFERSEAWRLAGRASSPGWHQDWVDDASIAPDLKRAVIASEDAGFSEHHGIDIEALQKAWIRNRLAEARSERVAARARSGVTTLAKVVGGSTITQQLAKNLFLSGERRLPRKAQELVIALMLEAMLPKRRILEIYLNSVEWGEGVFGAQAAAHHYFHLDASRLGALQCARLAVYLPAPKRFELRPASPYVAARAAIVAARMAAVVVP